MAARLTPYEKALRDITERQFQRQVEEIMTMFGWRWFHAPDNKPVNGRIQNIKAGYPDLTATRGRRLLYAELKRETGKTSEDQDGWLADLAEAGAETYVWRPSDLASLTEVLKPRWVDPLT